MQYHRQSPEIRHLGPKLSSHCDKGSSDIISHTQLLSINSHGQEKEQTGKDSMFKQIELI